MLGMNELLLLTNGPGELSTWVPPVLDRLRQRLPQSRFELYLLQDQFSAGTEVLKARELPVDRLGGRKEFLARLLHKGEQRGAVLMLGGALRDAVLMGRRLGYPAFAYSISGRDWHPGLRTLFVDEEISRDQLIARGADSRRIEVVGSLIRDSLEASLRGPSPPPADILLFPSSRPYLFRYLLGFMLGACERLAQKRPGLRCAWVRSRLLPDEVVASALEAQGVKELGGVASYWEQGGLRTEGGLWIGVVDERQRYAAMAQARLALTIPGTNTLELALAQLPTVVLMPLHKSDEVLIPLPGWIHWLWYVPGGRKLRAWLLEKGVERIPYLALPNQRLGAQVYPELKGRFHLDELVQVSLELLEPKRQEEVRQTLKALSSPPGADRLVDRLLALLETP
jgi:hypothetical protein